MNFLLPAQTLLDLCAEQPNAAQVWAHGVDTRSLRVSVISIAQAQAAIMRVEDAQLRARLDADFAALIAQIEADAGPPLAFETGHAEIWKALVHDRTLTGLGQTDRQVYATALHEGLVVVEERSAASAALQSLSVGLFILGDPDPP